MLYTKIQPQRFLGSGEEEFYVFLPYIGMAAILIYGPRPFLQSFNPDLTEGSTWSFKNFGPGVSEEKLFEGVTDGQMDDRLGEITIAHSVPSAQVS